MTDKNKKENQSPHADMSNKAVKKSTVELVAQLDNPILNKKFIGELIVHMRAAVPAMVVDVRDRRQFQMDVRSATESLKFNLVSWNADTGLSYIPAGAVQERPIGNAAETAHPYKALELIKNIAFGVDKKHAEFGKHTLFIFRNFQDCWSGMPWGPGKPFAIVEMIVNCINIFKNKTCSFLFYGPSLTVPPSLADDVQRLEYSLPGREALVTKFKHIEDGVAFDHPEMELATKDTLDKAVLSTQGLTVSKAEQSYAISLIKTDFKYNTREYWMNCAELRRAYIKEMGLVEIVKPHGGFKETFGGYSYIQRVIKQDMLAMTPQAQEYGVDKPAGFLVGGPAGTGKSVLVKATGHDFGLDVLWVSANKILDSKYGESEKRLKAILDIPELYLDCGCILWFDECDKLFGSLTSKGDDSTSGTGLRLLSILLTYLQERNYNDNDRAYIMATFNDGTMLPDALVRPGRFNSRVWIGLPSDSERHDILTLHLKKRKQDPSNYDLKAFVKLSEGCTGAELEYAISESIKQAFCDASNNNTTTVERSVPDSMLNSLILNRLDAMVPQSQNENSEYHEQTLWAEQSGFINECDTVAGDTADGDADELRRGLLAGPENMVKLKDTDLDNKKLKKKNDDRK